MIDFPILPPAKTDTKREARTEVVSLPSAHPIRVGAALRQTCRPWSGTVYDDSDKAGNSRQPKRTRHAKDRQGERRIAGFTCYQRPGRRK